MLVFFKVGVYVLTFSVHTILIEFKMHGLSKRPLLEQAGKQACTVVGLIPG